MIGSRPRKYIQDMGNVKTLIIRRLRCEDCRRIHHEPPAFLLPYKRYQAFCIEKKIHSTELFDVAADQSTLYRWNRWFQILAQYWLNCLRSLAFRFMWAMASVNPSPSGSLTVLEQLGHFVGDAPGWLTRMAKPIINVNLWIQTRSAFLPQ